MRVLIACEYSGVSRRAFEALGHDVWSADFEPAEDGALNHYQGDCFDLINGQHWDLMIAHPPCTQSNQYPVPSGLKACQTAFFGALLQSMSLSIHHLVTV